MLPGFDKYEIKHEGPKFLPFRFGLSKIYFFHDDVTGEEGEREFVELT